MVKVSIIVPVYKVERVLNRCVESLIGQTLQEIEIILVDDGSPDRCGEMCDAYGAKDPRIKVIHKKNAGLGYARNSGLQYASGEFVTFVDSDDYVEADMYRHMYQLAKDSNADFVRADNYRETLDGRCININYICPLKEGKYNKKSIENDLLYPLFGLLPSETGKKYISCSVWRNLYRTSIIREREINFCSERQIMSEDIPFILQFLLHTNCAYVTNKKLYHYVVNDKSLTTAYRPEYTDININLYKMLSAKIVEEDLRHICQIRLDRLFIERMRRSIKQEALVNPDKKQVMGNIRHILKRAEVQKVLNSYPINQMPLKYRLVTLMMKWKMASILKVVARYL